MDPYENKVVSYTTRVIGSIESISESLSDLKKQVATVSSEIVSINNSIEILSKIEDNSFAVDQLQAVSNDLNSKLLILNDRISSLIENKSICEKELKNIQQNICPHVNYVDSGEVRYHDHGRTESTVYECTLCKHHFE